VAHAALLRGLVLPTHTASPSPEKGFGAGEMAENKHFPKSITNLKFLLPASGLGAILNERQKATSIRILGT
jgi:hypothetical protein